jgi:hypothetical protein
MPPVANVLPPGHAARVHFTEPPQTAEGVVVRILERVALRTGKHPHFKLGEFHGRFVGGKLVVDQIIAAPLDAARPVDVFIRVENGEGQVTMSGRVPRPNDAISHTLAVQVEADGFETFTGQHVLHIDDLSVPLVFYQNGAGSASISFGGYAALMAKHLKAKRLGKDGKIADGAWSFENTSVAGLVKMFHDKTGMKASELHVISHANNGLDLASRSESEMLEPHVIEDVKIVWHGCYACNFFDKARRQIVFENLPHASVYGHKAISVQAGMPWAFIRIRKGNEVDIDKIMPEVLPRAYVLEWAAVETNEGLKITVEHEKAEEDVKTIARAEQEKRKAKKP